MGMKSAVRITRISSCFKTKKSHNNWLGENIMDKYKKNIIIGVIGNYLIMTIACIIFSKPGTSIIASRFDAFLLCTFAGYFSVILNLIFPVVLITAILAIARLKHYKLFPFFISSSLILYPICMIIFQNMFGFFEKAGGLWQPVLIAAVSCLLGFFLDRKFIVRLFIEMNIPNKNDSD